MLAAKQVCLALALFLHLVDGSVRSNVRIIGTSSPTGSLKSGTLTVPCPNMTVPFDNGLQCCAVIKRSAQCPTINSTSGPNQMSLRFRDPSACCSDGNPKTCSDHVRKCSSKNWPVQIRLINVQVSTFLNGSSAFAGINAIDRFVFESGVNFWQSGNTNGYEFIQVQLSGMSVVGMVRVQDRVEGPWNNYVNVEVRVGFYDATSLTSPGVAIGQNDACDNPKSYANNGISLYYYFCSAPYLGGQFVSLQKLGPGTLTVADISVFGTVPASPSFCLKGQTAFNMGQLCCSTVVRSLGCTSPVVNPNLLQWGDPPACCISSNTAQCPVALSACVPALGLIDISEGAARSDSIYSSNAILYGPNLAIDGSWTWNPTQQSYWQSACGSSDDWVQIYMTGIHQVYMVVVMDKLNTGDANLYQNVQVRIGVTSDTTLLTANPTCDLPKSYNNDSNVIYSYICSPTLIGNYVSVQKMASNCFHMQQMFVYGVATVWETVDVTTGTPYMSLVSSDFTANFGSDGNVAHLGIAYFYFAAAAAAFWQLELNSSYTVMMVITQDRLDSANYFPYYDMVSVRVGSTNPLTSTTVGNMITVNGLCGSPQSYQSDSRTRYYYLCGSGLLGNYISVQGPYAFVSLNELWVFALVSGYSKCNNNYFALDNGQLCCQTPLRANVTGCPSGPTPNLLQWSDPAVCCSGSTSTPCQDTVNGCATPLQQLDLTIGLQTISSSVYGSNPSEYVPAFAVDGYITASGGNTFVTLSQVMPYVQVQLAVTSTVVMIRVQSELYCCWNAYLMVEARVGPTDASLSYVVGQPITVNTACDTAKSNLVDDELHSLYYYVCQPQPIRGRYISLQRLAAPAASMLIDEIYVFVF